MLLDELLKATKKIMPPLHITKENTAMLLIDMQKLALSDHIVHVAESRGIDKDTAKEALGDYDERFAAAVRQSEKILHVFRGKGMTPIHVKIEAYSGDARDTGYSHKIAGFIVPPGSEWGKWIEEVTPLSDEIVLTKTCSGAVVGTMLDKVLRSLGVKNVITTGFYTDQCVETTVRDLADLGYDVVLVQDATMTVTMKRYQNTMENVIGVYARGMSTDEILGQMRSI